MTRPSLVLALLLVVGAGLRLVWFDVPPFDFHPTRQYRSALIARAQSDAALAPLPVQARANAAAMGTALGEIEPLVIEPLAAHLYDLAGHEDLRLPRAVSVIGWLLAAVATGWIVLLAGLPHRWAGAAIALTLLLPYGIDASRAFMPDPWMTGLTMAALAVVLRAHQSPSPGWLLLRLVLAGAAIYVKPMAVFFVAPALLLFDVLRVGIVRGVVFAGGSLALAAAPAAWHYVQLFAAGDSIGERRFFPELWTRLSFWQGWAVMAARVVGPLALVAWALGTFTARGVLRPLLLSLALGYVALGLTFSHHISTHDYYSLPLLPLAAIGCVVMGARLERGGRATVLVPAAVVVVTVGVALAWLGPSHVYGDVAAARQRGADYEAIGRTLAHPPLVISLDGAYGFPVAYHAIVQTRQLPLSIDRAVDAALTTSLRDTIRTDGARYFIGTLQPELDADPLARAWLEQRHHLVARGGSREHWRHVVYDLATPASVWDDTAREPDSDAPPLGFIDAPPADVALSAGAIAQGWALDDRGLAGVEVLVRDARGERPLGVVSREGERPDVSAAFPQMAELSKALWRFMMWDEDAALAGGTLVFRAVDRAGQVTVIGERPLR